ncbi:translation initiation factor IF-2-like [Mustela erminea]|uniref:translation initiation factor IF-2-like n=1 Tax=Mustela erminea TaxID=36723 RepID=UPI0013873637|nr:translation initiation factor IF-2-like [Mustela erminea]
MPLVTKRTAQTDRRQASQPRPVLGKLVPGFGHNLEASKLTRVQQAFRTDDLFAARPRGDTHSGSQARRLSSACAGNAGSPAGLRPAPQPRPRPQGRGGRGRRREGDLLIAKAGSELAEDSGVRGAGVGGGRPGEGALLIAEAGSELAEDVAESLGGGGGAGGGGAHSAGVLCCGPVGTAGPRGLGARALPRSSPSPEGRAVRFPPPAAPPRPKASLEDPLLTDVEALTLKECHQESQRCFLHSATGPVCRCCFLSTNHKIKEERDHKQGEQQAEGRQTPH